MKIFITGVSSGIGKALAKKLIISGHDVWGIDKEKNLLEDLRRELNSEKFFYNACDVTKEEEVFETAAEMERKNFLPDIAVLNAGIEKKDPEFYDNKITKDVFSVNFFGALIWVELFIKKFIKRGSGQFIAISSIFAQRPDVDSVSYCSSKASFSTAFRSLYLRYYKKNIIFTNIYFGPVDTKISSSYKTQIKKSFFVISPEFAAKCIIKAIKIKKQIYYFPLLTTLPVRLTFFLSDSIFLKLTKFFRR